LLICGLVIVPDHGNLTVDNETSFESAASAKKVSLQTRFNKAEDPSDVGHESVSIGRSTIDHNKKDIINSWGFTATADAKV
jgi:hypothetical protein